MIFVFDFLLKNLGFLTDTSANNRGDKEQRVDRESRDRDREKSTSLQRVKIVDANLVYDGLNLGRRIDGNNSNQIIHLIY